MPTGVAVGPDGGWYVGQLTGVPFTPGAANIFRIDPTTGAKTTFATGFTNVTDIAWGADGSLYVLHNGIFAGGTGSIQKLEADGRHSLVYGGLVAPTGLAIGGDGSFYVTNFSPAPGVGQVLQISAIPEPSTWAMVGLGLLAVAAAGARRGWPAGPIPQEPLYAGASKVNRFRPSNLRKSRSKVPRWSPR